MANRSVMNFPDTVFIPGQEPRELMTFDKPFVTQGSTPADREFVAHMTPNEDERLGLLLQVLTARDTWDEQMGKGLDERLEKQRNSPYFHNLREDIPGGAINPPTPPPGWESRTPLIDRAPGRRRPDLPGRKQEIWDMFNNPGATAQAVPDVDKEALWLALQTG